MSLWSTDDLTLVATTNTGDFNEVIEWVYINMDRRDMSWDLANKNRDGIAEWSKKSKDMQVKIYGHNIKSQKDLGVVFEWTCEDDDNQIQRVVKLDRKISSVCGLKTTIIQVIEYDGICT